MIMTNQKSDDLDCPLCSGVGGELLFEDAICRVVLVSGEEGRSFPGFCRVVGTRHVREMSDLSAAEQRRLLDVVLATERAIRAVQQPDKMNLASLGNVVPHVHWHVIPRWRDDSHFPGPIWTAAQRAGKMRKPVDRNALHNALHAALKTT
ncbi:HIT family protein [Georgfuchsia toluolica]|uniref:HIT family protein n=2 Tax=Georgfuchsia toluolica TaxID=424218 RepID=A0A916J7F7_9PROT|nr:HIT family protein [Georgfuchsia toluolica]